MLSNELLDFLGITEADLDENEFNPNFNESQIKLKLIEYLSKLNNCKIEVLN